MQPVGVEICFGRVSSVGQSGSDQPWAEGWNSADLGTADFKSAAAGDDFEQTICLVVPETF